MKETVSTLIQLTSNLETGNQQAREKADSCKTVSKQIIHQQTIEK